MKNKDFTQIPNFLIKDKNISDAEFRTLCLLKSYKYGERGKVFPSQATIAGIRGKSRRIINAHLRSLRKKQIIDFKRRGYSQSNIYKFIGEENFTSIVKECSPDKLQNLLPNNTEPNNTETKNIYRDVSNKWEQKLSEDENKLIEKIVKWCTLPEFNTLAPEYAVRLQITHTIQKWGFDRINKIWDEYACKPYAPHPKNFWNAIKQLKEEQNDYG
ncbi:MAG: helix-turn-helix domain-containing protein [Candidatus Microgenomates bacterium]|jgi:hypothetical protein